MTERTHRLADRTSQVEVLGIGTVPRLWHYRDRLHERDLLLMKRIEGLCGEPQESVPTVSRGGSCAYAARRKLAQDVVSRSLSQGMSLHADEAYAPLRSGTAWTPHNTKGLIGTTSSR